MGDYNSIRTNHDFMSFSIYNFLDNLLAAVRPSDTLESESQNRDQITTQVKPGGYSEDIFIFLSDREKEEYNCSVCYSVVKDAHQCRNGHKFCYSCIYVWSTCNRSGADCCPACRCDGVYARNDQLNEKIGRKRVKCVLEGCNWRGFLRDFNDHEHRIYDFRELNSSIELPFLKEKETSFVNSVDLKKSEIIEVVKINSETLHSDDNNINTSNAIIKNAEEETNVNSSLTGRVSRTNIAPRRLSRGSESTLLSGRASMLRPTLSNYPRSTNLTTRCPTYRNSINTTRLSRLPRSTITNVDHVSHSDNNSLVSADETSRQIAHNEYTQTNFLDSTTTPIHETSSSSFNTESPRLDNNNIDLNHRGVSGGNARRGTLLPAINSNNTNHVSADRAAQMEYRRLAPTYASRRGANFGASPNEGREQLAMMLILLTSDLEDRVTLSDQTHDPTTSNHIQTSIENAGSINESVSSNSSRTSVRLGRSRLQEFRNLNRRLSEVANSLDRLIASTSREGDHHHRHHHTSTFSGTPESSTSNATSDADEEFNINNNNNNNDFYR